MNSRKRKTVVHELDLLDFGEVMTCVPGAAQIMHALYRQGIVYVGTFHLALPPPVIDFRFVEGRQPWHVDGLPPVYWLRRDIEAWVAGFVAVN